MRIYGKKYLHQVHEVVGLAYSYSISVPINHRFPAFLSYKISEIIGPSEQPTRKKIVAGESPMLREDPWCRQRVFGLQARGLSLSTSTLSLSEICMRLSPSQFHHDLGELLSHR